MPTKAQAKEALGTDSKNKSKKRNNNSVATFGSKSRPKGGKVNSGSRQSPNDWKNRRNNKLVITFDDSSRQEFVSGMRKRKNERRLQAKRLEEQKKKEILRQERKNKRAILQSRLEELDRIEEYFDMVNSKEESDQIVKTVVHDDGDDEVQVTTTLSIPNNL